MRILFNGKDVTGELYVHTRHGVLEDRDQNSILLVVCALVRKVSLGQTEKAIRLGARNLSIGPILNPDLWDKKAMEVHSANLDVLRRFEDLKRALIECDEVSGLDPHINELEVLRHEPGTQKAE